MAEFELDDSGVMACLLSAAADNRRTKEPAGHDGNGAVIVGQADNKADIKSDKSGSLGTSERAVLEYIAAHPSANQDEVAGAVGISRSSVAGYTPSLQKKGLLRREGSRKSGTWVVIAAERRAPQ